ncbi:MAG TPA: acyl-CoA dehydrogenase family protein [Acidimicrobiales bacterium]|nr:acyl-CoA dehydrogenase family protein [Acidimicrobiales bacterium]
MDLLPTPEQQEISSVAAALLAKTMDNGQGDARRRTSAIGPRQWAQFAELGWFGLSLPEERGGVGYGMAEEALLFREIGRHLAPGPFLACTLGARVALAGGADELATAILTGEITVGLAQARGAAFEVGDLVSGTFDLMDAVDVSHVVVVTRNGAALMAAEALGRPEQLPCIDPAVSLGRVHVEQAPAIVHASGATDRIFERGSVLAAAMLAGIGEATRDMASVFGKNREQFGKPIGVHQAVKHRCADMAMRAEAATSQVMFAALAIDEGRPDLEFQTAAAKVVAGDAGIGNAGLNIQIHGGMGYTFEHDAHLFLKRAHVLDRMLENKQQHMARLIDLPAAQ